MSSKIKLLIGVVYSTLFILFISLDIGIDSKQESIYQGISFEEGCAWCGDDEFICAFNDEWLLLGEQIIVTPGKD